MSTNMDLAELALEQTKFAMLEVNKSVFVSTLFYSLRFYWDDRIPTGCTDGIEIRINPDFFLSLQPNERISFFAHETWHVAFQHMLRRDNRNPYCWNKACDYVINEMLHKNGYSIPNTWLLDKQYFDMSSEEVYEILYQDPDNHQPSGMDDLVEPSTDPATAQANAQTISSNIMKAQMQAASQGQGGSIPAAISDAIKEMLTPPINWRVLFQRYMHKLMKVKLTYKKPKKRYFPDFILPTKAGKAVDKFVVACDSSGSVSDEDLSAFLGQINEARRALKPSETTMLMFDTSVNEELKFKPTEVVEYLDFKGRGGTDPECVIYHVNQMRQKPICLVIFSDMDFEPLPKSMEPSYPVLWVSYKAYRDPEVNFGQLIIMPEKTK